MNNFAAISARKGSRVVSGDGNPNAITRCSSPGNNDVLQSWHTRSVLVSSTSASPPTPFRAPSQNPSTLALPADCFQRQTSEDSYWSKLTTLAKEALTHTLGPIHKTSQPAPVTPGQLDFYRLRAQDFKDRHNDQKPPDYYLNYGDKYARRFEQTTRPEMTPQGQQWMDRTFLNLQVAVENERSKDPAAFAQLEENSKAFRHFAFSTHPKAYLDAGLADLPTSDLILIAGTPDTKDLWSKDGRHQVEEVAAQIFAAHGIDIITQKADDWIHHPWAALISLAETTLHHTENLGHQILQWLHKAHFTSHT